MKKTGQEKWILYLSILAGLLLISAMVSVFSRSEYAVFFNSDTLYFPSFYHALFVEKIGLDGWHTGPSPHFFPDNILYFLLMFLSGDFLVASLLFPMIQFGAIVMLIHYLFRVTGLNNAAIYASLAALLLTLHFYVTLVSKDLTFGYYLVSNAYHVGSFVLALASLALSFKYLKERKIRYLVFLFLIGTAGIVSDKLFIILYILPMLSLVLVFRKLQSPSSYFILMGVNILSVILGLTCINLIKSAYVVWIGEPHRIMDWGNIPASWDMLIYQFGVYMSEFSFKSIIIYLCIAAFIASTILVIDALSKHKKLELLHIYFYFSVFYSLGVFFAPVVNGNYTGFDTLRYSITVFYLLLINIPLLIWTINRKSVRGIIFTKGFVITLLAVSFIYAGSRFSYTGMKKYFSFYPDTVASVDHLAQKEGLKRGVGDFWMANYCTVFSKTGLYVYPVHQDMVPYHHLINHKGFYNDDVAFDFILLNRFEDPEAYTKRTGWIGQFTEYNDILLVKLPPFRFDQPSLSPYLIDASENGKANSQY